MTRIISSYRGCGYRDPKKAKKGEFYCGYPTGPLMCDTNKSSLIDCFPWDCPLKKENAK